MSGPQLYKESVAEPRRDGSILPFDALLHSLVEVNATIPLWIVLYNIPPELLILY